jgi:hypothetical protein
MTDEEIPEEEAARLELIIPRARKMLARRREIPDEDADIGAAMLALVHAMLDHADAILTLSRTPQAETGMAHLRVMLEGWMELESILTIGDARQNALRYAIFGALELRDTFVATGQDPEDIAAANARVEEYRARAPEAVAAEEKRRAKKRRPHFWSDMGRSKTLAAIDAAQGTDKTLVHLYKVLSWDAHHIVAPALNVWFDRSGGELRINYELRQTPEEASLFIRATAARILDATGPHVAKVLRIRTPRDRSAPLETPDQ